MSTANTHPGLSFGVGGIQRGGFPPSHPSASHKPPPNLSQHASPYPPQAYNPQQPPQGPYSHHLFPNGPPPQLPNVPSVASIAGLQNGARPAQHQGSPAMPTPRQRAPPPRQMQPQLNPPLTYLQPSMKQQQLPQQPIPQPSLSQQALNQQALSQQPVQPKEDRVLSQKSTPRPPSQPALPPPTPVQPQIPQIQQVQQQNQVAQQAPQVQQQQQPPTAPPDPVAQSTENHHVDDMEVDSPESGDGDGSSENKLADGTPYVPRQPMGPMMSPPPEGGGYPTLEALHKAVLGYCTSVGYAIVIGRSKRTVPGLKKVLFVCDRAGKPPKRVSEEARKRKTTSRKCDCQFGFFAIEQRTQWTVRYRPDPSHLQHNHGPSESPALHPAARKLDSKMVAAVKSLKESGVGVTQTLEILQQENPDVPLLPRDIYNARAAINRNPSKVATDLAENRAAIYSKPQPSPEERIRADLRRELANAREERDKIKEESRKEIEVLKEKLREKDKIIEKFEMFIDICNQRVILQRERLADGSEPNGTAANSTA